MHEHSPREARVPAHFFLPVGSPLLSCGRMLTSLPPSSTTRPSAWRVAAALLAATGAAVLFASASRDANFLRHYNEADASSRLASMLAKRVRSFASLLSVVLLSLDWSERMERRSTLIPAKGATFNRA